MARHFATVGLRGVARLRYLHILTVCSVIGGSAIILPEFANAQRMLTVGDVGNKGGPFSFTLVSPTSKDTLDVSATIPANTSAANKGSAIAAKVNTPANIAKGWSATSTTTATGTTLTFTFKGKDVTEIDKLKDATDEVTKISSLDTGTYRFDLESLTATAASLDTGTAAGLDGSGATSFVSVQTPLSTAIALLSPGESIDAIIASLETQLIAAGNDVLSLSSDAFQIIENVPNSFISFQNTDLNLISSSGATNIPEPATWMLLTTGLLGLTALARHNQKMS